MVVDAQGHVFVGDFGFDLGWRRPGADALKRVDPDGTVTVVAEDCGSPNGIAITPDGAPCWSARRWATGRPPSTMAADGSLTNRRVWAEFGPVPTGTTGRAG